MFTNILRHLEKAKTKLESDKDIVSIPESLYHYLVGQIGPSVSKSESATAKRLILNLRGESF
jgi:hypothetical protein